MRIKKANGRNALRATVVAGLVLAGLAAVPAMGATTPSGVSVTPSSGANGTTFTITFLTPSAAPKGAYRVHGKVGRAATNGCATTFDFSNPKRVAANQHIKFSFRITSAQDMCTGRWTVTARRAGGRLIGPSGHFTLR